MASAGRSFLSFNFAMVLLVALAAGATAFVGLRPRSPLIFVFVMAGWMVSLCLHEFGHALAAYWGGDRSVETRGYLSLDPMKYVQPVLSLVVPMLFVAIGGFGFPGGAVYIDHRQLRSRGVESLVSAAGPMATLLCFVLLALPFRLGLDEHLGADQFWGGMALLAFLQVTALVLNLLPLPGLDGFGIISPFLPRAWREQTHALSGLAGMALLVLFLFVPTFNRAFFGLVTSIVAAAGIEPTYVGLGFYLFRFWR
jgi:Zn-dependent protease